MNVPFKTQKPILHKSPIAPSPICKSSQTPLFCLCFFRKPFQNGTLLTLYDFTLQHLVYLRPAYVYLSLYQQRPSASTTPFPLALLLGMHSGCSLSPLSSQPSSRHAGEGRKPSTPMFLTRRPRPARRALSPRRARSAAPLPQPPRPLVAARPGPAPPRPACRRGCPQRSAAAGESLLGAPLLPSSAQNGAHPVPIPEGRSWQTPVPPERRGFGCPRRVSL